MSKDHLSFGENKWDIAMIRYQIQQLRREREHLSSKRNERQLTQWERKRVVEIAREMTSLVKEAVTIKTSQVSDRRIVA